MIYNCKQASDEWFKLREKRLTASHGQAIATADKGLDTYINDKILELIVGRENYTNADIERGNEIEPIARITYEFKTGNKVKEVGFITPDNEFEKWIGISPDGLVGYDGGVEFKARNNKIHLAILRTGKIDTKTIWQIQMSLLVTKCLWWDFGSYNPNFNTELFIKRVYPDLAAFKKLENGFKIGIEKFKVLLNDPKIQAEL